MSLLKQPQISDSVVALAFHYFLRAVTSIEVLRISSGQYRFFLQADPTVQDQVQYQCTSHKNSIG
jgi:hypothetical protein